MVKNKKRVLIFSYLIFVAIAFYGFKLNDDLVEQLTLSFGENNVTGALVFQSMIFVALGTLILGLIFYTIIRLFAKSKIKFIDAWTVIMFGYMLRVLITGILALLFGYNTVILYIAKIPLMYILFFYTPYFLYDVTDKTRAQQIILGICIVAFFLF